MVIKMKFEKNKILNSLVLIMFCLMFLAETLQAAYLTNVPVKIKQPNGTEYDVFASGDEFYNWIHDAQGFTIIQDQSTGYYVYAKKEGEILLPTSFVYGQSRPELTGLQKELKFSDRIIRENMAEFIRTREMKAPGTENKKSNSMQLNTGTMNNIVVFIRFSGEAEFTDNLSTYTDMFNATSGNSMYNYFWEASYNQLTINSSTYPETAGTTVVSYQDANPRGYYQPYSSTNTIGYTGGDGGSMRRDREHTLLVNAVNAINSQVPTSLNLDFNSDGYVDNVCFIISGSPTGWASLLWPHMWSLYSQSAYINGKRVYTYNFQIRSMTLSSGVGVLCHEMFHSLGSPDLYHYTSNGIAPVYQWDVMENNQNPPQHMGAYMKFRYGGWISSIPEITTSGVYTLNPLVQPSQNCYKIRSPNSSYEYFVVEYRKKEGTFENSLPGTGLLIYRINTSVDGEGNRSGPPDEVYIYRPNGTTTANGSPGSAHFSGNVGRTVFNNSTNPACFLTNGSAGYLDISEVSSAGSTISFRVTIGNPLIPTLLSPIDNATNIGQRPTFTWNTFSGALSYNLQVATSTDFTNKVIDRTGISGTSFTALSDLNYDSDYYWRVSATTGSGTTGWSSTFKFTTLTSIRIDSIVGSLCAGYPFTVYYTVGAAFGTYNAFKVQVSDTLGMFSSRPLELQYVNTNVSGSIPCVLPDTIPGGSKYRMRIVADDPATVGLNNGKDLTITPLLLPFVNGPLNVCEFSTITYQTSNITGISDKWEVTGGTLLTKPDSSIIVVNWGKVGNGTLKLSKRSVAGCFDSIVAKVKINPIPTPEITGNFKTCRNSIEVYTADLEADLKNTWSVTGGRILSILNDKMVKVAWEDSVKGTITLTQTYLSTKCQNFLTKDITINSKPLPEAIAGKKDVCRNDVEIYFSKAATGTSNLWLVQGGTIIGKKNKDTVTIRWENSRNGTLTLVSTLLVSGCTDTSKFDVNINPKPEPMPVGLASGCENSMGMFYVIHDTLLFNNWTVNGGIISNDPGSDTCKILWGSSGTGSVTLRQTNKFTGCYDSVRIDLEIAPKPPTPSILRNDSYLISSADNGNQWYLNDIVIEGANGKNYEPKENGDYSVVVTIKKCSSLPSAKYNFIVGEVSDLTDAKGVFEIIPNPSDGNFRIAFIDDAYPFDAIQINNIYGELVYKEEIQSGKFARDKIISQNLANGIYFIIIYSREKAFFEKIIINK